MPALSIGILQDLTQFEYNGHYYDFHNDFTCEKWLYENGDLLIFLNRLDSDRHVVFKFNEVQINVIDFFNSKEETALTIDTLYRGRIVVDGNLIEASVDNKGYFYLEFYEGQRVEFWAKRVGLLGHDEGNIL